jgi:hypothetical protein
MTAFEAPPATEAQGNFSAKALHKRTIIAVMALLMAIAGVALVSTETHSSFPSDRSVLACGTAPGLCPSPPGPSTPDSKHPGSSPHPGNSWL